MIPYSDVILNFEIFRHWSLQKADLVPTFFVLGLYEQNYRQMYAALWIIFR